MNDWLVALGLLKHENTDYLENYEKYKNQALSYIKEGAITCDDTKKSIEKYSRKLSWDLVLIDESQDWPENERDFIYSVYGYKKLVIADGINQFVRGISRVNWTENIDTDERQFIKLKKSLRLKSSLCETVGHFGSLIGIDNWDLEPEMESHGGKFIVVVGDPFSPKFHSKIAATAKADGNHEVDLLLCVPPTWVSYTANGKVSKVAEKYREWGKKVWDGVDLDVRSTFPTSLDEYRVVQYESCRGLEGWVVVNFGFDEFYDYKLSNAEIDRSELNLFYKEEEAKIGRAHV